jgi:hypothetical protein
MKLKFNFLYIRAAFIAPLLFSPALANAANFTITSGNTVGAQTIGAGAGETGTIDEGGTISTNAASAATSTSVGGTLINRGTITTTGASNSHGMVSNAANNTVQNYGSITTNTNISNGMRSTATNTTMDNYGTIIANGPGMRTSSTDNTLTNYGSIVTSGTNSEGIAAAGDDNTIINNGTITVTTLNSDGLGSDGGTDGNTFINNGTINVSGTGTSGIANFSTNATVTNNGTINATGNTNIAIYNNANATVILGANSKTNGSIDFNGGTNQLQYDVSGAARGGSIARVTGGVNGTVTTSVIGTASLAEGAQVVQSGDDVAVVTADNFAGTQQAISQTVNYTNDIINQRQQMALLGKNTGISSDTQVATDTSAFNDASPAAGWGMKQQHVAWAEGFGSYQERADHDDMAESQAVSGGVLTGVDMAPNDAGYKTGAYIGVFAGNVEMGANNFREIDNTGFLAGGYVGKEYGKYYVNGQLAAGFSNNDSDRQIGGTTASADYNSYFVSPSVTVMRPYAATGVTLVPSVTVRYTGQHDAGYSETGSVANQIVDSRFINTLGTRAVVEAHIEPTQFEGGVLTPVLRAGVEGATTLGGGDADVTVLGSNLTFDPQGSDNVVDGILGANVAYDINSNVNIYADAEASVGLNHGSMSDNLGGTGRLGARWKF